MKIGDAAAVALAAWSVACGGEPRRQLGELETVDVSAPPDAEASLADEPVAQPVGMPASGLAGALPESFPAEVPLPRPSSLVDFASRGAESTVALVIDLPGERVRETYRRQLAAAGFREQSGETFIGRDWIVRFEIEPFHDATRLTIRVARH